jgi:hypothetical protein
VPNAVQSIPNYNLCFFYHRSTTQYFTPSDSTLQCVRLYPTGWIGNGSTYTNNRYVSGGADFVNLLNTAASAGGDLAAANPYWVSGDVTFIWNAFTNQMTWKGNTATYYYANAGCDDPFVQAAQQGLGSKTNGGQTGWRLYEYSYKRTVCFTALCPWLYLESAGWICYERDRSPAPLLYPQQANSNILYANLPIFLQQVVRRHLLIPFLI